MASRTFRIARTGLVAGAVVLTASGCLSVEGDLTLDREGDSTGFMEVSLNKQAASLAGISSLKSFQTAMDGGDGAKPGTVQKFSETDTDYVARVETDGATMSGSWKTTANEDEVAIDFDLSDATSSGSGSSSSESGGMDFGRVDLTINFPGSITRYSGEGVSKVDDDTIRVQTSLSKAGRVTAASTVPSGPGALPLIIGGVVLAAAAGTAGAFVVRSRKSRAQDGQAAEAGIEFEPVDAAAEEPKAEAAHSG